jgi:hypothetical protein
MSSYGDESETSTGNAPLHIRQHPHQHQQNAQHAEEGIPPTGSATASASTGLSAEATISSGDFSDMPSLSSYRSMDDKSASSRGGVDCDMSLPSLSSFRFDEVSMASSHHSRGSTTTNATNHVSCHSEESNEGWGSFSGNVSKSDISDEDNDHKHGERDDDIEEDEFALALEKDLKALQMGRHSGLPPIPSRPPAAIETKSILRNKGEGFVSSSTVTASKLHSAPYGFIASEDRRSEELVIQKGSQATRSSNSSLDGSIDSLIQSIQEAPSRNVPKRNPEGNIAKSVEIQRQKASEDLGLKSPQRGCIDRNESMPLSELQKPSKDPQQKSNSSSSSFRYSPDGSSSSLRGGGDSLPRLPKRSSTIEDGSDANDKSDKTETSREQQSAVVGESLQSIVGKAPDEDPSSSDGELSLEIGGNGEDDSIDCSVDTVDDNSVCFDEITPAIGESLSGSDVTILSDTELSFDEGHKMTTQAAPTLQKQVQEFMPGSHFDSLMQLQSDRKDLCNKTLAPVEFVTTSTASLDSSDSHNDMGDLSLKPDTLSMNVSRKHSGSKTFGTKGSTNGADAELEDTEETKDDVAKRRNLIRRMSSSLKKVGRSASFRESFRSIGKTASKIRRLSFRKDNETGDSSSSADQRRTIRNRSSY